MHGNSTNNQNKKENNSSVEKPEESKAEDVSKKNRPFLKKTYVDDKMGLGVLSVHFGAANNDDYSDAHVSFEHPMYSTAKLGDGSPMGQKYQLNKDATFDSDTNTFEGYIDFSPSTWFNGCTYMKFKVNFTDEFKKA